MHHTSPLISTRKKIIQKTRHGHSIKKQQPFEQVYLGFSLEANQSDVIPLTLSSTFDLLDLPKRAKSYKSKSERDLICRCHFSVALCCKINTLSACNELELSPVLAFCVCTGSLSTQAGLTGHKTKSFPLLTDNLESTGGVTYSKDTL